MSSSKNKRLVALFIALVFLVALGVIRNARSAVPLCPVVKSPLAKELKLKPRLGVVVTCPDAATKSKSCKVTGIKKGDLVSENVFVETTSKEPCKEDKNYFLDESTSTIRVSGNCSAIFHVNSSKSDPKCTFAGMEAPEETCCEGLVRVERQGKMVCSYRMNPTDWTAETEIPVPSTSGEGCNVALSDMALSWWYEAHLEIAANLFTTINPVDLTFEKKYSQETAESEMDPVMSGRFNIPAILYNAFTWYRFERMNAENAYKKRIEQIFNESLAALNGGRIKTIKVECLRLPSQENSPQTICSLPAGAMMERGLSVSPLDSTGACARLVPADSPDSDVIVTEQNADNFGFVEGDPSKFWIRGTCSGEFMIRYVPGETDTVGEEFVLPADSEFANNGMQAISYTMMVKKIESQIAYYEELGAATNRLHEGLSMAADLGSDMVWLCAHKRNCSVRTVKIKNSTKKGVVPKDDEMDEQGADVLIFPQGMDQSLVEKDPELAAKLKRKFVEFLDPVYSVEAPKSWVQYNKKGKKSGTLKTPIKLKSTELKKFKEWAAGYEHYKYVLTARGKTYIPVRAAKETIQLFQDFSQRMVFPCPEKDAKFTLSPVGKAVVTHFLRLETEYLLEYYRLMIEVSLSERLKCILPLIPTPTPTPNSTPTPGVTPTPPPVWTPPTVWTPPPGWTPQATPIPGQTPGGTAEPGDPSIAGIASIVAQSGSINVKQSSQKQIQGGKGLVSRFSSLPVRSAFAKEFRDRSNLKAKEVKLSLAKKPAARAAGFSLGKVLSSALVSNAKSAGAMSSAVSKEMMSGGASSVSTSVTDASKDARATASTAVATTQKKYSDPGSGLGSLAVDRPESSVSEDEEEGDNGDENFDDDRDDVADDTTVTETTSSKSGDPNLFKDDNSIFSKITKAYKSNYKDILPESK